MKWLGIVLVGIGIAALVFQYGNKQPMSESIDGKKATPTLGWPMYVGALSMAAGAFILMGKKKNG